MEIIIIGALFVALMVYVSTKIKRAAARAYEEELVEKEEFRLVKPAGLMYPLHAKSEFPFEAYSRFYGDRGTRNIWRARTRLRTSEGMNVRKVIVDAEAAGEVIDSEKKLDDLETTQVGSILRSSKEEDGVEFKVLRKIVGDKSRNKTYELRTTILSPFEDEFTESTCELMHSFEVTPAAG